jgi:hypothetical protein
MGARRMVTDPDAMSARLRTTIASDVFNRVFDCRKRMALTIERCGGR